MSILNSPLTAIAAIPPATRYLSMGLVVATSVVSLLRASTEPADLSKVFRGGQDALLLFPWIVTVPGSVIWNPWTLFTSAFVEGNVMEFIISILTLPIAGRYLERVWGQIEFLKFIAITVICSNLGCVAINVIEHFAFGDSGDFLYGMSYHGLMGLQTGFLVAFTQLIPEHQVQLLGGLAKMRVKRLPMLYVAFSNVMCIIGYQSPFLLIQLGWLVSWAWLRFFKYNEGGDFRGDRSDTFAFAMWFPPFIQKYIHQLSAFVFNLLVKLKLFRPWSSPVDVESGTYTNQPGGARAEAERRRALALKALDQRLASKPTRPPPAVSGDSEPAASAPVPIPQGEVVFDATQETQS